jgi:hypothetical protein
VEAVVRRRRCRGRIERPALFTRNWQPPNFFVTVATSLSQSSIEERSQEMKVASPPSLLIRSITGLAFSGIARHQHHVRAALGELVGRWPPRCPRCRPVTTTTLPRTLPESERSMKRSGSRWRSQ